MNLKANFEFKILQYKQKVKVLPQWQNTHKRYNKYCIVYFKINISYSNELRQECHYFIKTKLETEHTPVPNLGKVFPKPFEQQFIR